MSLTFFRPPPPPNSEKVSFSCERKKEGAALVLPVEARREDTICPDRFRTWMLGHIDSWFDFSQQNGLGIMMEDIVLLTGCHRTTSRSNIIFHASRTDSRVSLRVQSPHPGAVYWEVLNNHGAMLSHGPSGEVCEGCDRPMDTDKLCLILELTSKSISVYPRISCQTFFLEASVAHQRGGRT